jgi:hypothetical protein
MVRLPRLLAVPAALALGCSSPKTGSLRVDWSFEGGGCDRAGVMKVDAMVDGTSHLWFGCRDENEHMGATFTKLPVGTHRLELTGTGLNDTKLWTFSAEGIEIAANAESHLDAPFTRTSVANPMDPTTPAMKRLQQQGPAEP